MSVGYVLQYVGADLGGGGVGTGVRLCPAIDVFYNHNIQVTIRSQRLNDNADEYSHFSD